MTDRAEKPSPAPHAPIPRGDEAVRRVAGAIPEAARAAAMQLHEAGHRTVFVGGGVRDALLGLPVREMWDVGTAAVPDEVSRLFPEAIPTGLAHGTLTVPLDDDTIEITTFRTEGAYSDARRPDEVRFVTDLSVDLRRRDFTINAIAYDPASEELIDETGGLADLADGVLRAVGDPRARLEEDALRALRAARFVATLGFGLDPGTEAALASARPGLIRTAAERVREELDRLLCGLHADRGLEALHAAGLLEVLLPELVRCRGVAQNRHHRYDVYRHSLETVYAAEPRSRVRWAALCHDLGKPETRAVRDDGEATFYGHPQVGAEITDAMLRRLRFANAEREAIVLLVREHLFDYRPEWSDAAVRRFLRRVGEENLEDLFALRRADIAGTGLPGDEGSLIALRERIERELEARSPLRVTDLVVGGKDVLAETGLRPGPEIGRILDELLELVLEDPSLNRREVLIEEIRKRGRVGGARDGSA